MSTVVDSSDESRAARLQASIRSAALGVPVQRWRPLFLAVAGATAFATSVAAITINVNPAPNHLTEHPNFDPDLSKLTPIIQAAADYWEGIILDNHVLNLTFGYLDLEPAVLGVAEVQASDGAGRPTQGGIAFDTIINSAVPSEREWYFDPTPFNNSEFNMQQVLVRDLTNQERAAYYNGSPQALLEAGYWGHYAGSDLGDDLFSVALHEIGHILGVTNTLPNSAAELADGDYDFNPSFVNGASVAAEYWDLPGEVEPEHLRSPHALMSVGAGQGDRHLPGATDVFAAAATAGWNSIDLYRMDFLGGTVWNLNGNWEGGTDPDSNDDVYVRHGGDISILLDAVAGDLTIRDGSSVTTNDNELAVTDDVIVEAAGGADAVLTVESGGLLTADDIHVAEGGRLITTGSIFGTAVEADLVRIHPEGLLFGTGRIVGDSISNSGTITAIAAPLSPMNVLALDVTPGGSINLDGTGDESEAQVFAVLASVLVSGPLSDPFDGQINVGEGRVIFFDEPWTFGSNAGPGEGTIHLDGGASLSTAATVNTDAWTATRGRIDVSGYGDIVGEVVFENEIHVDVDDGAFLVLSGSSSFDGGTYTGDGTIRFEGPATIEGNTTIEIAYADLDGVGGESEMTISGGTLTLRVERIDDSTAINRFDGTMNVNGLFSRLNVELVDPEATWEMNGELNLNGSPLPGTLLEGSGIRVTGTVNVDGIAWTGADLDIEGSVVLADATAELGLGVGTRHIIRESATITGPGTLDVRGQSNLLIENGAEIDVDLENGGRLEPGASVGEATIDASFLQTGAGTFAVELGGVAPGSEYDRLNVSGGADIAGTLEVTLTDAGSGFFVPEPGDLFTILTAAGGVVGEFDDYLLPTNLGGEILDWQVIYPVGSVVVQLLEVSGLVGDYNGDGSVDAADYTVWRDLVGSSSNLAADGDQNGVVDDGDYEVWQANFGMTAGGSSAMTSTPSVPEPAAGGLVFVALGVMAGWPPRRTRRLNPYRRVRYMRNYP